MILTGKGKNALHRHAELVLRVRDRLVTPMWVLWAWHCVIKAQIVDLYNDGMAVRPLEVRGKRVLGGGYFEAAPASVTVAVVRTKHELVDRRREPGRKIYAACCRRTPRSEWATRKTTPRK